MMPDRQHPCWVFLRDKEVKRKRLLSYKRENENPANQWRWTEAMGSMCVQDV